MSELSLSNHDKTNKFSNLLISDFFLFCSSVLSQPLYLFYIAFFSPYLFKLFSFLSPLFITTSLLIINGNFSTPSSSIVKLEMEDDGGEFYSMEAIQVYNFVFDTSTIDIKGYEGDCSEDEDPEERILQAVESSVMKISHQNNQDCSVIKNESLKISSEKDLISSEKMEKTTQSVNQEKSNKNILKLVNYFENMKSTVEEKKVDKVVEKKKEEPFVVNGFKPTSTKKTFHDEVKFVNDSDNGGGFIPYLQRKSVSAEWKYYGRDFTAREDMSRSLESGLTRSRSTRREKEWNRTLACKLFEERHNVDGSEEGMDSLWEAYERDPNKAYTKRRDKPKGENAYYRDDDGDEDEHDDEIVSQLCCLQAFKYSAGKMNLGVGKRNLARISKAVKGIKWLHNVSRESKKKLQFA